MRNTIITNVNGRDVAIDDAASDTMALGWLRARGFVSVKEGCGEGDCGACTVALGTPGANGLEWRAVASCLLFLPMLDGRAVLTVEGLGEAGHSHPVQTAMAEGFGTQCGFCSPGITMSLFAMARRPKGDDETILDGLAGNLCRCTGYRPIMDLARGLPALGEEPGEAALAAKLAAATTEPLRYGKEDALFAAPRTLEDALAFRGEHPDAWVLAGGTDLGLTVTKRHQRAGHILSLSRVEELTRIGTEPRGLVIGAAVSYATILENLGDRYPGFHDLLRRIGAAQVRNQGTLGGNLGNASPIGDSMPCLIALGAEVELASKNGRRRLAVEDFITGYRATALHPDELIAAVHLPDPTPGDIFKAYKVARRKDQDISTVAAAFRLRVEDGRVTTIAAAFGGVAGRPLRARRLEAMLLGQPWTLETVTAAQSGLAEDIAPQDDFRGTAAYRRQVAGNLVVRLWYETTAAADALPVSLDAL